MKLTALPTELVENITNYLDLASFRYFRLICRSLKHQSLHDFKERFFRKRTITWTVESFQRSLAITSHPLFGSILQDLVIDATPRHAIRLWMIKTEIPDAREPLTEAEFQILKQESDNTARRWNETRFDQKTLIKMFERIRVLQSLTLSYDGMDRRYGKFGRRYCETSQNEMSRPFVSTLNAIVASGISIRNIYTHGQRKYGAISIGRLESLSPVLSKFEVVFEQLQTLNLNLRDWRHPEEGFEPLIGKTPFVVRFLSKCKNIRRLDLSCYSSFEDDLFAEMAIHCIYPHLESCKLSLFRIYAMDDLVDFLAPARNSLRALSLNHVVLRDDDAGWPELMHRMSTELEHLDSIELKSLFTRIGSRLQFRGVLVGTSTEPCPWTITLVQPMLRDKLQSHAELMMASNSGPAWHLAPVAYPFIGMRV